MGGKDKKKSVNTHVHDLLLCCPKYKAMRLLKPYFSNLSFAFLTDFQPNRIQIDSPIYLLVAADQFPITIIGRSTKFMVAAPSII